VAELWGGRETGPTTARHSTSFAKARKSIATLLSRQESDPHSDRTFGVLKTSGAVFYSHVTRAIVFYPIIAYRCTASTTPGPCDPATLTQSRNLGHGDYYGAELTVERRSVQP
jgi:hypothetical protein